MNDEEKYDHHDGGGMMDSTKIKSARTDKLHRIFWDTIETTIEVQHHEVLRNDNRPNHHQNHHHNNHHNHHYHNDDEKEEFETSQYHKLSMMFLVNPSGIRKVTWDAISGLAILYSVVEVPFLIAFLGSNVSTGLTALDLFVTAIFAIDIVISFNLTYNDPISNKLVTDRVKIATGYMKMWFWIDCLATIPFDSIASSLPQSGGTQHISGVRLVRILRLFRLAKVMKFSKKTQAKVKDLMEKWNIDPSLITGTSLLLQIFFAAHLIGCFWFFIGTRSTAESASNKGDDYVAWGPIRTWSTEFGTEVNGVQTSYANTDLSTQYIAALYWTAYTIFTVGYGDIHPTNTGERFYALLTMLVGSLLFGAIIAKVREVIESRNLIIKETARKEEALKGFLEDKSISKMLKSEAKDAYTYYMKLRPNLAENGLYNELPPNLSIRLVEHAYQREISQIDLFRDFFDRAFIASIMVHSRPFMTQVGQVIYEEGDVAECMCFILRGSVRITRITPSRKKDALLGYATAGNFFGDFEYYKSSLRIARFQCVRNCTMYSIDYEHIRKAVEDHFDAGVKFLSFMKSRYDNFQRVLKSTGKVLDKKKAFAKPGSLARKGSTVNGKEEDSNAVPSKKQISTTFGSVLSDAKRTTTVLGLKASILGSSPTMSPRGGNTAAGPFANKQNSSKPLPTTGLSPLIKRILAPAFGMPSDKGEISRSVHAVKSSTGGSFWVDGEQVVNESEDDHLATEAIMNFAMGAAAHVAKYPVVAGLNKQGKDLVTEKPMAYFHSKLIFHPNHPFKLTWDAFLGCLIIYSLIVIPMQMAFDSLYEGDSGGPLLIFDYVIDGMFFMDMVVNCNTAYYSDKADAFILERQRIRRHYSRSGWMLIDLVSCVPFDIIVFAAVQNSSRSTSTVQLVKVTRLLRLLKLMKILDISKFMNHLEEILNVSPSMVSLVTTMVQVVFISHLVCCMWWGLCKEFDGSAWFDRTDQVFDSLRYAPFQDQYVASLYWTITTLTTTGYGDIYPVNNQERIVNIIIMVLSATVFGYVVANISNIVREFNAKDAMANERIAMIKEYLRDTNASKHITNEVLTYFRQALRMHSTVDDKQILTRLPFHLRTAILVSDAKDLFDAIPVFAHIKSPSLKLFLLNLLTFCSAEKGHRLVKEGSVASEVILITSGKATICRILDIDDMDDSKQSARSKKSNKKEGPVTAATIIMDQIMAPILKIQTAIRNLRDGHEEVKEKVEDDDDEDSDDDEVVARKEKKLRDELQRKARAQARWQKVRESLPLIVQSGLESTNTNFSGITELIKPNITKAKIVLHDDRNRRRALNVQNVTSSKSNPTTSEAAAATADNDDQTAAEGVTCEIEELGELRPGDCFGFHAMRLSLAHACTVVANESVQYYTLSRADLLSITKDRPDVAFEIQTALGITIFEVDRAQGKRQAKKRKVEFLNGIRARFKAVNQAPVKKPHLAVLIKRLAHAPMDEKLRMMERFRIMAEQERRAKSKFQSMYKILETVFPLVIPDEPEPTKAAEIETGEGDLAAASGGGGVATPGATPKAGGMTGTMRSELEMNDADAALPRLGSFGNFGNLLSTPKGGPLEKRGSRSSAADHNSRASFQGYLHPATPKPSTAQKSRALAIKKAKKARSFSERDSRLQRLESLYAGYLEERIRGSAHRSGLNLDKEDDVVDRDLFGKYCMEKNSHKDIMHGGAHLTAIHIPIPVDRVASVMSLLRGSNFNSNNNTTNPDAKVSTKQVPNGQSSGNLSHLLVPIDENGETNDADGETVLDRVGMSHLKQETFLKSHRSFTDLYDMSSSHQYEILRPQMTMTYRRNSFPSFAKME